MQVAEEIQGAGRIVDRVNLARSSRKAAGETVAVVPGALRVERPFRGERGIVPVGRNGFLQIAQVALCKATEDRP